jgi:hypothetical protein
LIQINAPPGFRSHPAGSREGFMLMSVTLGAETVLRGALDGIPQVNFLENLRAASISGAKQSRLIGEIVSLRRGPGRLTPQEYFYYRLWDSALSGEQKRSFVGKRAQARMHLACNEARWHAAANDKLLFHAAMSGAGLPVPRLLAVIHPMRRLPNTLSLRTAPAIADLLRQQEAYPLFVKPIDGMYSLGVVRAEQFDPARDEVVMHDGARVAVSALAAELAARPSGYLVQRALHPHPALATAYGDRLWSARLLVLLGPEGPEILRAVCKVPTGVNVADNYWRDGNLLTAVEQESGIIRRVVRGTGKDLVADVVHPDTGRPLVGVAVPDWDAVLGTAIGAAWTLPGVRTQSWDVAITDAGPVLLEVNWGGDLNLAQLAWGRGVLDDRYRAHLCRCGYRL